MRFKKHICLWDISQASNQLYNFLQSAGYILVFKPLLLLKDGKAKGNCDAELVLQAMIDYKKYEKALIVTGDGDFYCLIKYLKEQNKLLTVLAPTYKNCSCLITEIVKGHIGLVSDLRRKIEHRKMPLPDRTERDINQS